MTMPVPILLYHSVSDDAAPRYRRWAVRLQDFAAQMHHLRERGYGPITVSHYVRTMDEPDTSLPERPVVLTFDDGFLDFYTHALPVLTGFGFCATQYIVTGYVGGTAPWLGRLGEGARALMDWRQVCELPASGVECGAHSHTHPWLDALPPEAVRDEVVRSKQILEQRLGRAVATFAYPFGYNVAATQARVRDAGYASACALKHAMSAPAEDRFALSRVVVPGDMGIERFAALVRGEGLPIAPTRERLRTTGWRWARRSATLLHLNRQR